MKTVDARDSASARALARSAARARAVSLAASTAASARRMDSRPARARSWLAVSPLVPGARAGVSAPTSSSPREARDGIDRTASTRLDASAGSASAGFPRAGAVRSGEARGFETRVSGVCFFAFQSGFRRVEASSPTRAHPPRALDHRRPDDVRAVRHAHGGARDVQRRGEERHEHAFARALQASPAVHRQGAPLFHLGAFRLCASTPVQSNAVHPRENTEAARRARGGGGVHHVVVGER